MSKIIFTSRPALRVVTARNGASQHACPLKRRPWLSLCNHCCSCFKQCLLAAWPDDCLLSIGCRTDRRHDWRRGRPTEDFRDNRV